MKYDNESIEKRKFWIKNIKNILAIALFIFLIIIIYNIFLVIVSASSEKNATDIMGYSAYIITTDSMEPTINSGDVIVIKKIKSKSLKKDDIITFSSNSQIITHRIVDKEDEGYITKGDNNNSNDLYEVKDNQILGVMIFRIHFLGKVIRVIDNAFHIFIIIIILITLYLHALKKNYKKMMRRRKKRLEDEKNK